MSPNIESAYPVKIQVIIHYQIWSITKPRLVERTYSTQRRAFLRFLKKFSVIYLYLRVRKLLFLFWQTINERYMWKCPYTAGEVITLCFQVPCLWTAEEHNIAKIKVWNYNKKMKVGFLELCFWASPRAVMYKNQEHFFEKDHWVVSILIPNDIGSFDVSSKGSLSGPLLNSNRRTFTQSVKFVRLGIITRRWRLVFWNCLSKLRPEQWCTRGFRNQGNFFEKD